MASVGNSAQGAQRDQLIQLAKEIQKSLQKLLGLHRQLLDNVRLEREALVSANVQEIQEATYAKEVLIETIRQYERTRLELVQRVAPILKKDPSDVTLQALILAVQAFDQNLSEQLRTALSALNILVERIRDQNASNQELVEKSLEHIRNMKRNVLGEASPKTDTYTQSGQKNVGGGGSRLISKEV